MIHRRRRWRTVVGFGCLIVLWCGLVLATLPTQTIAQTPTAAPQRDQVVRIRAATKAEKLAISTRGLDLLEMRDGKDLFALVSDAEIAQLKADGFTVSVDAEQTSYLTPAKPVQGGFRTVEEGYALLDAMQTAYPNLAQVFTYGVSWDKETAGGPTGYDLKGITLTNTLVPGPKPTFFLMSAIHAREMSTAEVALRYIEYLLPRYATDADIHWLLDEHTIVVVPFANPDGRKFAEQSLSQRKNRNMIDTPGCSGSNIGIDLNRNSNFKWGTVDSPSGDPCGATWPGLAPASEPEVDGLDQWIRRIYPDRRGPGDNDAAPLDTSGVFISLHSYSDLVLWPYGWIEAFAPNDADLAGLGRKFAAYNGYTPQKSTELYPTSGTTDDWAYGELGIAAYTFEIGPLAGASCGGFFPAFTCLDGGSGGNFWGRNRPALLYAAKVARTPYLTQRGPDALQVSTFATSSDYQVHATINDTTNGNLPLAGAEMYLDIPPWRTGAVSITLNASDGTFNSVSEAVQGAIARSISNGRHLVFVRGRDAANNWGPVSAAWLDVAPNGITGTVTTLDNGQPAAGIAVVASSGTYTSTAITAADGSYRLELPVGEYTLTASAPGFVPTTTSGQTVQAATFTPYNLSIVELARLQTTPAAITINAATNSIVTRTLDIGNAGGQALTAAVSLAPTGYEVRSSDDAGGPTYNWLEINTIGTRQELDDDTCLVVTLPQPLLFYGTSYAKLALHSNGVIAPTNAATCTLAPATNVAIPSASAPNGFLAAMWDDLDPSVTSGSNGVFTYHDAANNRYIVEFKNVPHYSNGGGTNPETFQFILDFGSGDLTLQYNTVADASNATVGLENPTGAAGLQWVYNAIDRLHNNLAIRYTAFSGSAAWLKWTPSNVTVAARRGEPVQLTINTAGLAPGQYRVRLRVNAGSATNGDQYVPITLHVRAGTVRAVALSGEQTLSGTIGTVVTYTLTLTNEGNISDTFTLALTNQTWFSTLSPTSLTLNAGTSTTVTVTVFIPNTANVNNTDRVRLSTVSQNDASATDSIMLTTTAAPTMANQTRVYLPLVVK